MDGDDRIPPVTNARARALTPALLLAAVLLAAPSARAQSARESARWQLSGGYAFMVESDVTEKETFPSGWNVSGAVRLTSWLSIAADADGQYKTIPTLGGDIQLTSHALTGGLRASARLGKLTEFGQVLAGAVRTTGTAFGSSDTTMYRAIQPGLGFDYPCGARWAIRGELDVRFLSTGEEIRVVAGIVRAFR
jgi:Outer membrane protein beta-barrel domain